MEINKIHFQILFNSMLELGSYNCSVLGKFPYCLNASFLKASNNKLYRFNERKF